MTSVPGVPWIPPAPSYLTPAAADGSTPRPQIASLDAAIVNGALEALWRPPGGGAVFLHRIVVSAEQTCRAFVYVGTRDTRNLVSGTGSGQFDENDPNQPYYVPEGTEVRVMWDTIIGAAHARLEYMAI